MSQYNRYIIAEVREMLCRKMKPNNIARSLAIPFDQVLVLISLAKALS